MVYRKRVKIKGQYYWYLFHTIRDKDKYLKKSKYIGKELPKNIEEIEKEFLNQIYKKETKEKDDLTKLIEALTPLERAVLPVLNENKELNKIIKATNLSEVEVVRALDWLQDKNILKINIDKKEIILLDKNGLDYKEKGLPEKRFLEVLQNPLTLDEIKDKAELNKDELNFCLGTLKRKQAIEFGKKIKITDEGKDLQKIGFKEEDFIKRLPLETSKLSNEDKSIYNELKNRKELIKSDFKKLIRIKISELGKEISKRKLKTNLIESLSSEMLVKGNWKGKTFRRFNIKAEVPRIYPGRRHFVNEAINYIRKIWTDLGFKEMSGNLVQTSFWNFDALFQPQDHPARDLQDTFFIKDPKFGKLPDKKIVESVKKAHEIGISNSKGWQYKWQEKEAMKNILRAHNTVLSAKTLASLNLNELPQKFFAVGKCFRNETLDWKHLFELTQVEGIVVDENANFRHLIGYLKEFFKKMGYSKVRVRPGYFPYTEPSAEVDVFHPVKKQWIELGGSGIFRPEVTVPLLGKNIPVLAWGIGLERTILEYYNIQDIRLLYKNDLKQLREIKLWLK